MLQIRLRSIPGLPLRWLCYRWCRGVGMKADSSQLMFHAAHVYPEQGRVESSFLITGPTMRLTVFNLCCGRNNNRSPGRHGAVRIFLVIEETILPGRYIDTQFNLQSRLQPELLVESCILAPGSCTATSSWLEWVCFSDRRGGETIRYW
jgi:hypothetical protein